MSHVAGTPAASTPNALSANDKAARSGKTDRLFMVKPLRLVWFCDRGRQGALQDGRITSQAALCQSAVLKRACASGMAESNLAVTARRERRQRRARPGPCGAPGAHRDRGGTRHG